MNTIKISLLKNLTTEQHNPAIVDIHDDYIFGEKVKIANPCNLNIFITNTCQNNCFFCINKNKGTALDYGPYLSSLENVLYELDGKGIECTITGGEPTILPNLLIQVMGLVHRHNIHCRTFSTSGYNLIKKPEILKAMMDFGFTHNINISRMHYDEKINSSIMGPQNITNDDIKKLALFFKMHDAEMRISCNLIPGCIDSALEVTKFTEYYSDLGVETVMFRELVGDYYHGRYAGLMQNIAETITSNVTASDTICDDTYQIDMYRYLNKLIKVYTHKANGHKNCSYVNEQYDPNNKPITSLSFVNGILREGFDGRIFGGIRK